MMKPELVIEKLKVMADELQPILGKTMPEGAFPCIRISFRNPKTGDGFVLVCGVETLPDGDD